jgi:hypothetical protein
MANGACASGAATASAKNSHGSNSQQQINGGEGVAKK